MGASVRYIGSRNNRGSGSSIRHQLDAQGVKYGEQLIVRVIP